MNEDNNAIPEERAATIAAAHDELRKKHPLIGISIPTMTGEFAADSLAALDAATHDLSDQIRGNSQNALLKAKLLGQALWAIKLKIEPGHWVIWMEQNSPYSPRRCQEFMQLARFWGLIESAIKANPRYDFGSLSVFQAIKLMRGAHNPAPKPKRNDEKEAGRSLVSSAIHGIPEKQIEEEPLPNSRAGKFEQESAKTEAEQVNRLIATAHPDALRAKHKALGLALQHLILAETYLPRSAREWNSAQLTELIAEVTRERAGVGRQIRDGVLASEREVPETYRADLAVAQQIEDSKRRDAAVRAINALVEVRENREK